MTRERQVERRILETVEAIGEATADGVARAMGVTRPAVARHLPDLVARGLLQERREAQKRGAPVRVYAVVRANVTEIGDVADAPNVTEIPEGNVTEIAGVTDDLAWRVEAMRRRIPAKGALPFLKARDGTVADGCLSCGEPLSPGYLASCDLCVSLAPSRRKPTGRRDTWHWR
jgi:DNA-binding transcriptional ArsR family regulator